MANQIDFSTEQLAQLKSLTDAGPSSYPDAYNLINSWVQIAAGIDSQTKLFFSLTAEINSNAQTAANLYIRTVTKRGLELTPGADSSDERIQQTSNAIAQAIFAQIQQDNGIASLDTIIKNDVTNAINRGGQTWGGWGGALFFLTSRVGPDAVSPQSVAKMIFSNEEDTTKFQTLVSNTLNLVYDQYGFSGDGFLDAAWQAAKSEMGAIYGVNDLSVTERLHGYEALSTIMAKVGLHIFNLAQFNDEMSAAIAEIAAPVVHTGDKINLSVADATAFATATASFDVFTRLAAALGIDSINIQSADQTQVAAFGGDGTNQLFGSIGADNIYGGNGNDIITGGADNDYLVGGAGNDVYFYSSGDGNDLIVDSDGTIVFNGEFLKEGYKVSNGVYRSASGNVVYTLGSGGDLQISDGSPNGHISLSDDAAGFGIQLIDSDPPPPLPPNTQPPATPGQTLGFAPGSNVIVGGRGDDTIGGAGPQDGSVGTVVAGDGNNFLNLWDGSFDIIAGDGWDIFETELRVGDRASIRAGEGNNTLILSADTHSTGGIYEVTAGSGNDDIYFGIAEHITVSAGAGNDDVVIGASSRPDGIFSGSVDLGAGDNTMSFDNASNFQIYAGNGNDQISPHGLVPFNWSNGFIDVGDGNNTIDWMVGANLNVNAGSGDDFVRAGRSFRQDVPSGGSGTINLGDGKNLIELEGDYAVTLGNGDDEVRIYGGTGSVDLGSGINRVIYNGGTYSIRAGSTTNTIFFNNVDSSSVTLNLGSLFINVGNGEGIHLEDFNPNDAATPGQFQGFWFGNEFQSYANLIARGFDIVGTVGDDVLTGTNVSDRFDGRTGADTMIGGAGDDSYVVDNMGDVVTENGGEGTDVIRSSVTYTISANVENLTLTGADNIGATGNSLNNVLTGNSGNNTLDGGAGVDVLVGGLGNDTYIVDTTTDTITENSNEGTDLIQSSVTYTLGNNIENLTLTGTSAVNGTGNALDNVLTGNGANNILTGGAGNDTLNGGAGTDTLRGGAGNDTYIVDTTTDTITENANEGTDTVQASTTYTLGNNVENLTLTGSSAINGTGNSLANVLVGNTANNVLNGGAGVDTMQGGLGNDTYVVDVSGDVVVENAGEGIDTIQAAITYVLGNNVENLTLTGTGAINGTGNALDNVLVGNSGNNTLTGGAGNDTLDGGTGSDTMIGGIGDDIYVVNATGDVVTENAGEGIDTVQASITYTLGNNVEALTLIGTTAINGRGNALDNVLVGNSANNTLTGGAGNDTLDGRAGNDKMTGGAGNDTYIVDSTSDAVTENANEGTDTVQSSITYTLGNNVENLILTGTTAINGTGNTLNNVLTGNSAANTLTGNAGNDTLDGGAGNDTLNGGAGNDTYVFNRGYGSDTLTDNDTTTGNTDIAQIGDTRLDMVFSQSGNNLLIKLHGTSDQLTIQNWFTGTANHVEQIKDTNGSTLLDTQVANLIQAMATFSTQHGGITWDQAIDQNPNEVQAILAANWQ